jgi:cytochrome P450
MLNVTRYADVRAVLADPGYVVPPVGPAGERGTIAWLRATVARFSNGEEHERRRALVERELARLDPAELGRAARERTLAELDRAGSRPIDISKPAVPVAVLAAALGVESGPDVVASVMAVAAAYQPGSGGEEEERLADAGVQHLVEVFEPGPGPGPGPDEIVANRIGLLVQTCGATTALIVNTLRRASGAWPGPVEEQIEETLRVDPPARSTRRLALETGTAVVLDLGAAGCDRSLEHLAFGSGLRPCPGARHAVALAAGVIEAVWSCGGT